MFFFEDDEFRALQQKKASLCVDNWREAILKWSGVKE